jgi:hypothetical protein
MRLAVVILLVLASVRLTAQESGYSDTAHYVSYMLGDWDEVIALGKQARKQGVDHYYLRARNGYAYFMKGKYMDAAAEFRKAVAFNPYSDFAQTYAVWSQQESGLRSEALLTRAGMTVALRDSLKIAAPRFFDGLSLMGGYRFSTAGLFSGNGYQQKRIISGAPVAMLLLSHRFGARLMLDHGISYTNTTRLAGSVWQLGYVAQLGVQVAQGWSVKPAFSFNHWNTSDSISNEYGGALSVQFKARKVSFSGYGGMVQAFDEENYFGGLTFGWYPLSNLNLYSFTSFQYSYFTVRNGNPVVRQTIGGKVAKGLWLTGTYTWNRAVFHMMAHQATFADNALEPMQHSAALQALYSPKGAWGVHLTYTFEQRKTLLPNQEDYFFSYHGIIAGVQLKF